MLGTLVTGARGPQIPVKLGKAPAPAPGAHLAPGQCEEAGRQWGRRRKYHTHEPRAATNAKNKHTPNKCDSGLFGFKLTAVCLRFKATPTNSLVVAANVK